MVTTRQQKMAQAAFGAVRDQKRRSTGFQEYASFAKSFPALIQTAGLCQAVAFAQAKGKGAGPPSQVLADVVQAYNVGAPAWYADASAFALAARTAEVMDYLRLTRVALQAATWVKRYVEALEDQPAPHETVGDSTV